MRAGACTVEQTLTSEAASVLKHSVGLARRRGHAQVTPLHVAATLMSSRVSLLRRACLKSHPHSSSHPLQCRALELCFNVALNRLPTAPGPFLHSHPSLSNALIAALKRAQAHQRRGCIEQQQQQQPLLAVKVELEQLIISILDDPSVSRVMREAGFSSTSVKNNLEDSASSSLFYSAGLVSSSCFEVGFWQQKPAIFSAQKEENKTPHCSDSAGEREDLKVVVEVLLGRKKRNTVIVGDCLPSSASLMSQLMEKVERGDAPDELKSVHFIKFSLSPLSMRFMKRVDVEGKVADLRRKVGTVVSVGGAIIYLGDLKWVADELIRFENYNPVDHMIAEIGKLVTDFRSFSSKVWLMGIANYQTYMKCQTRTPSLEMLWGIQPVAVPSGGLGLSLQASSGPKSAVSPCKNPSKLRELKSLSTTEEQHKLTCCGECASNYEKEAQKSSNNLPYWMQQCRVDNHHNDVLLELRRKWNTFCECLHHNRLPGGRLNQGSHAPSSYPWWATTLQSTQELSTNVTSLLHLKHPKNHNSSFSLDSFRTTENNEAKVTLALGTSLFSESTNTDHSQMREKVCRVLQANLPGQSDAISSISETLLDHIALNRGKGCWLVIEGDDYTGKRRLALAIADSVFGSIERLVPINIKKATAQSCAQSLAKAVKKNGNCVVFIEDLDSAEPGFIKLLARCFQEGKLEDPICRELNLGQSVIIISGKSDAGGEENPPNSVIQMKWLQEDTNDNQGTPKKRKADWDITTNTSRKYPKSGEEQGRSISRQSSFNNLDLNVSAEDESGSDLTQEGAATHWASRELVESIKNRFVLERNPSQMDQSREVFRSKIRAAAGEVLGEELSIEREVVEELVTASAYFVDSLFEKWLKDVFQTSCLTVKNGGKGGRVRLCLVGKTGDITGFLGSCLPNRVQLML